MTSLADTHGRSRPRSSTPMTAGQKAAIRATVRAKWEGHEINTARFVAPPRPMYSIGG